MVNVKQLKNQARREEQRENWARAIELYTEALEQSAALGEGLLDLSLYNRIGDLHLRRNDPSSAVEAYLEAVERYAEQELYGGAIALCDKILRVAPDRIDVYRILGRLHAATGLVAEARTNFLEYASRLEERGDDLEGPVEAFLELARLTRDGELHLEMVDRLLERGQREKAITELVELYGRVTHDGSVGRAVRERLESVAPEVLGDASDEDSESTRVPSDLEQQVREAEERGDLRAAFEATNEIVGQDPDDRDFDDMLVGFRARVDATADDADPEAHCEFGITLHQMGRLEDAIREFQAATRAPEPPIRAFELLGQCFLEQDLHRVAVRVLTRALRLPGHTEVDLLGVLYRLGLAHQALGATEQALECFERVYSIDIDFLDVGDRMRACTL